jgi:hypothetical protein
MLLRGQIYNQSFSGWLTNFSKPRYDVCHTKPPEISRKYKEDWEKGKEKSKR